MHNIINSLKLSALILAATLPHALAADVPFRGSFQAREAQSVQFPTLNVAGVGAGHATQLGLFSMAYEAEVDLLSRVGIGSVEFIAANGDRLFAEILGQSTPTATPNVVSILETLTITGGTGRFEDATGILISLRTLDQVTGETSGYFEGTIVIDRGN